MVKRRAKDRDLNRDHLATQPRLRIGKYAVVLFDKLRGVQIILQMLLSFRFFWTL